MISVERTFNQSKIHQYIEKQVEERINKIVAFLRSEGVEYTTIARAKALSNKPYTNRTFNLVSSVGFAIVRKGQVLESYFPLFETGSEGKKKGEKTSEKAAKDYSESDDVALVFVAGEEYASYVQKKGFDVTKMSSEAFSKSLKTVWRGKL